MTVWIVNPYDNLPMEGFRPQRYWLMARAFVRAGHQVVYWTSDFSHATKEVRRAKGEGRRVECGESGFRLVMIPTLPYRKNVCLARVRSHRQLARDFAHLARRELSQPPQLVIASMPPLGLCEAARVVARECGALFVADVQDAWPETFERILPRFVWSLLGMRKTARRLYCLSDGVSAVAKRYVELARDYGCAAPTLVAGHAIEMGARTPSVRPHAPLRLAYIGNMSLSYDLETVIAAVRESDGVVLDIAGNGPDCQRLETMGVSDKIRFRGYLDEAALADLLAQADVGLIPMFPESCVGVPGKLADYAKAGLRVIESLGGECREIVERYGVGCHYQAGDVGSLKAAIEKMVRGASLTEEACDAFRSCFDADKVMPEYVKWIEGLEQGSRSGR